MMLKIAARLGLALLTAVVALTAAAQEGSTPVIGGDEAAVREFVAQALGRSGPPEADAVIYIARLPEAMPFDLPLPEQTRVTGAVVRDALEGRMLQILLVSDQSARSVVDFYSEALPAVGWRLVEDRSSGGFVSAPQAAANFCLDDDKWFVNMTAADRKDGGADVFLYAQSPNAGMLCRGDAEGFYAGLHALMPVLTPPEGVRMSTSSSGGGGGPLWRRALSTEAALISSGPEADAIVAHYNSQLESAGWSLADTAGDARVSWSRWTFTSPEDDTPWSGTLVVIRSPLADSEYHAQLRIEERR